MVTVRGGAPEPESLTATDLLPWYRQYGFTDHGRDRWEPESDAQRKERVLGQVEGATTVSPERIYTR